ncbi:hypothetical protein ACIO93_38280 [Streptomyces sp. NPDC087903]|uniref:hypothetical protein n=1 Tax=Streptomyces sp. NPDC087903 TaxID=3365819 RepID=UPI003812097B
MHAHDSAEVAEHGRRRIPVPQHGQRSAPTLDPTRGPMTPAAVLGLQRAAGNSAVGQVVQRMDTGGNVQDMLTTEHWDGGSRSGKLAKAAKNALKLGKGKKGKGSSKSKARSLDEVLSSVIPGLLESLADSTGDQLVLFRTMPREEADEILAWQTGKKKTSDDWMESIPATGPGLAFNNDATVGEIPVKGHMGDEGQARHYYDKGTDEAREAKAVLKFVLKPGAHDLLFSPQYMALASQGEGLDAIRNNKKFEGQQFPTAADGEGNLPGYIGVKSEKHGPFSLLAKSKPSQVLFQTFVAEVVDVST